MNIGSAIAIVGIWGSVAALAFSPIANPYMVGWAALFACFSTKFISGY